MSGHTKTYVVIKAIDLGSIDFSQVDETNINTVRCSIDESLAVLKYEGTMPSSISSLTTKTEYTFPQIENLMHTPEWEVLVDDIENL